MEVGRFILAWCVHGYWLHAFCVRPLIMGFGGGGGRLTSLHLCSSIES